MKIGGTASLQLFTVQDDIQREIKVLSTDRMLTKLGLSKPERKIVQGYDMPVIPVQDDFFLFPFRQLSQTIVGGGSWKATDFSADGVLKKSKKLLVGKPAYLNHNQQVGKEIGTIGDAEWAEPYKHSSGIMVPAGIEAPFILDKNVGDNSDLIRKMMAPISPVQCCSVSVFFDWEASHEFKDQSDFYWQIGNMIDEEMVRRNVTKIIDYVESSLVWMGADPFARLLDDNGKVVSIDRTAMYAKNQFADEPDNRKFDSERTYFVFDCFDKEKFLHLSASSSKKTDPKPKDTVMFPDEILAFLAVGFGITVEDIKAGKLDKAKADKFKIVSADSFAAMKTKTDFDVLVGEKKVSDDALAALKLDKTKVDADLVAMTSEKAKLEPLAKVGENVLTLAKAEAKRVYTIFAKEKAEKVILDELEAETDMVKLDAKIKTFGGKAITEFGGKCAKCGGTDINFRSSTSKEEDHETKPGVNQSMEDRAYIND